MAKGKQKGFGDELFGTRLGEFRDASGPTKGIYTYHELRKARAEPASYSSGFQPKDTYTSKYYNENWAPYEPRRKKSRRAAKIVGITLAFILAIVILIAVDPFSPSLSVNPSNLCFTVSNGLNPPPQTLQIKSSRGGITWAATDDAEWLNLNPASGSTDRETSITLLADISGMYPGEYVATVTFSAPDARNTPLRVTVTLVISETKETLAIEETVDGNVNNVEIYYKKQPPYSKGLAYTNIDLLNNQGATDPTWQQLLQFLVSDDTDEQTYIPGIYMCGSFAEALHNSAEQEGIRAAWVAVDFEDGETHSLNAFDTVDRGIVFVDCTGGGLKVSTPSFGNAYSYDIDYDKIAYIQLGEEYGLLSLDKAESASYGFYEEYKQDWDDYVRGVDEYNRILGGRTVIYDYGEYMKLKGMYDELESQREILGDYYWEPLGFVSHIEVYW